jgi:hypothetical protein
MTFNKFLKEADTKIRKSLLSFGKYVAEVEKDVIQRDVYDYYDNIRNGLNSQNQYTRTNELKNNIRVYYSGKNRVVVKNESHTPQILEYIQQGKSNWAWSYLYRLSVEQRKRPFVENTQNEVNKKGGMKKYMRIDLAKNGLSVSKR